MSRPELFEEDVEQKLTDNWQSTSFIQRQLFKKRNNFPKIKAVLEKLVQDGKAERYEWKGIAIYWRKKR